MIEDKQQSPQITDRLLRVGDYGVLAVAGAICIALVLSTFGSDASRAVIRSGGKVVAEIHLSKNQEVKIDGALGPSVVEVLDGRVRVASDPSPRQLCVRQGWLQKAGDAAICLPNQVTVELVSRSSRYDSLTY
ncbi:MAG: NusG domain II-containing protein [Pseudomonadota bacterium]